MAITESSRHRLHRRLEALLGEEEAGVLMEHLPPVGWADVATRQATFDHLGPVLRSELRAERAELRTEFLVRLG